LEEVLAGQILAFADDSDQALVGDRELALDAALRLEPHPDLAAGHLRMAGAQRGRAEALVGLRVSLVADPQIFIVHQPDDGRRDRVAGEAALAQIRRDPLAQLGQSAAEIGRPVIFRSVAAGSEAEMIAILLPAFLVIADRLNMPVGVRAEPGVAIGRGQGDRVQPVDLVAVCNAVAVAIEILPVTAVAPTSDAGAAAIAMAQAPRSLVAHRAAKARTSPFVPPLGRKGRLRPARSRRFSQTSKPICTATMNQPND
jgi:hypothetical protein